MKTLALKFGRGSRLAIFKANGTLYSHSTDKGEDFCSTVLLTAGPDQTYTNLACAAEDQTDHLLASTTPNSQSSTSQAAASSRPSLSITSPTSTTSSTPSLPASTTPSSTVTSSPVAPPSTASVRDAPASSTNNTGAIVGGAIGGLAFMAFLVFATLVLRRLKSLRTNGTLASSSFWRLENKKIETPKVRGSEWAHQQSVWTSPIELTSERPPTELPSGRQYETPELYNHHLEAIRN
ncbi:MAG: hypothetical protein Q9166_001733 [cf. Caloplaca sp. 2 TL-2023]